MLVLVLLKASLKHAFVVTFLSLTKRPKLGVLLKAIGHLYLFNLFASSRHFKASLKDMLFLLKNHLLKVLGLLLWPYSGWPSQDS